MNLQMATKRAEMEVWLDVMESRMLGATQKKKEQMKVDEKVDNL